MKKRANRKLFYYCIAKQKQPQLKEVLINSVYASLFFL